MFACTRKDRLIDPHRLALPGARAARSQRDDPARAFRDADALAGRFERGELVRVSGRVERFRDQPVLEVVDIARVERRRTDGRRCRPRFLPIAYRDLDELDGFLEHLAGEVARPRLSRAARRACSATRAAGGVAPRAVHARRAPRLPRRAARAHGGGGDARATRSASCTRA